MNIATLADLRPPTTLAEAVERLDLVLEPEEKRQLAQTRKDDIEVAHHLGLGLAIRNAFQLHAGNPELLASCGVTHPDDASTAILIALWERLQQADE